MPDIKLYDYQQPTGVPVGTKYTQYWSAPDKKTAFLAPRAPWEDAPMMAGFYDEHEKLLGVRFIFIDGTYQDAKLKEKA